MMNLTIGITVYNRMDTLRRMIRSLFASKPDHDGVEWIIRVYDDCSDEFDENDIRTIFPVEIDYHRHEKNHGSDYNIGFMYRSFLETGDDILFNCDSDLIFDKDWISAIQKHLPETDGVLSLFNTQGHKTINTVGDLCIKDDVGSAGCAMTREAVELICNNIGEKDSHSSLDYNWCSLFGKLGKKIYCTSRSYVQHIGFDGFNSSNGVMDIGDGFRVGGSVNGQILGDVLYDIVSRKNSESSGQRNFVYLFPYDKVPYGSSVVIYGAGVVGMDYRRQLEMTGYCNKLIQVDKNYTRHKDVCSTDILSDIECDYVVIAANLMNVRQEMREDILKINSQLKSKLIDDVCRIMRF